MKRILICWCFVSLLVMNSCTKSTVQPATAPASAGSVREVPVVEIPLEGDLADAKAEISGLTWCGDHLILIPQYPARFAPKDKSYFYTLTKAEILDSLAQNPLRALKPSPVELDDGEASQLPGYEGFEAAACFGEHFYAAVETKSGDRMMGYLFVGKVNEALTEIKLDKGSRKELPPQAKIDNFTNEALAWTGEGILSFYEANGAKVNPDAHALVFDRQFNPQKNAPMPSLEYRLTDATPVDEAGNFWVINYFYPGDTKIKPDSDPLALNGEGASHQVSENVERLVQLHWDGEKISLGEHAPIWLQLRDNGEARNWEGLAQLDDKGFLLVTDTHPRTILGFVKANP